MNWYKLYGLDKIIGMYGDLPREVPLFCHYEHGWTPLERANPYDLLKRKPLMLVFSRRRLEAWRRESTVPAVVIGTPFAHYRAMKGIGRDPGATGTVAFPAHSTEYVNASFDIAAYCDSLAALPPEFHPITICLHENDYARKKHEEYEKHDFRIVTAGACWVPGFEFVDKFYGILKTHKYCTSNQIGSYTFYAVEMGIPFFVYGEEAVMRNNGETLMPSVSRYSDYPTCARAIKLFSGPTTSISPEQEAFVRDETGMDDCLTGPELKRVLMESNQRATESYAAMVEADETDAATRMFLCDELVNFYKESGNTKKQLEYILKTFGYGVPKPEFLNYLGQYFMEAKEYRNAVYWFELAARTEVPAGSWLAWEPHVQLCVCYDRMGRYDLAYTHNELARGMCPDNGSILHNKRYLEKRLGMTPA